MQIFRCKAGHGYPGRQLKPLPNVTSPNRFSGQRTYSYEVNQISMIKKNALIILIAPNVTEQMGGEGIKALQIFQEIAKLHPNTIQITHERNRKELSDRLKLTRVYYVADIKFSLFLWHSRVLSKLLDPWF